MINLITPEKYFSDLIDSFSNKNKIKINDNTKIYLILFLKKYINSNLKHKTLFEIYEKCILEKNVINNHSDLGDQSLFISGIFPLSIKRKTINISYFINMGQIGYLNASRLNGSLVFKDLSENFTVYMSILRKISTESFILDKDFSFREEDLEFNQDLLKKLNRF